jgi:lysophospholipase L1-like esterase
MEGHDSSLGPDSSWPGRVQDILASCFPGVRIECINAATAGYTSAESLSEFLFRGIDLQPDILLVYHNVNDAWTCQMVDRFKSDYSHARTHKPWNVGWINRIPQIPFLVTYQLTRDWVMKRYGKANALIYWISDPPWKTVHSFDEKAVRAFKRNIVNLVSVAQAWSCVPVLIKWECDWEARRLPPYLENSDETINAYFDYLRANNRVLEEIAAAFRDCHYLEVGPFEPHHFTDAMHFSSLGLQAMTERVADKLEPIVRSVLEEKGIGEPGSNTRVVSGHY